jgi:hypothetical protein
MRLLLLIGLLLLLNGMGVLLARALAPAASLPTFFEVEGCEQPCWMNIKPGITTMSEFDSRLEHIQTEMGGWMFEGTSADEGVETPIASFTLDVNPTPQIRLGDAIVAYGEPDGIFIAPATPEASRRRVATVYLYFMEGRIEIRTLDGRLSPDLPIRYIGMRRDPHSMEFALPWRGFHSNDVYRLIALAE